MKSKRILTKIDEMEQYLRELREIIPESFEVYKASIEKRRAIERLLQITIEAVMDTCALLVKEMKLGLPSAEEDFLEKLKDEEVLSPSLVKKLKSMRGFRNILVHGYSKIREEKVWNILMENIKDFEEFKKEVILHIKKEKK